jgi:DNA-binding SARP family transcriptional activator
VLKHPNLNNMFGLPLPTLDVLHALLETNIQLSRGKMKVLEQQAVSMPSGNETTFPVLICLLGSFLLLKAGHPVALRPGGKSEALLSHLSLQVRDGIPRDTLLHLLWPTSNTTLASQALHSLVYSLHKLIGDALSGKALVVHHEGGYQLNTEAGVMVDVALFDALVRAGDQQCHTGAKAAAIHAYNDAIGLYRGDLCLSTDTHTVIERERLRARYLTLLAYLADYHYDVCNFSACLEYAWRLLACDPCREDAHRLVMRCNVRQGKRAEALHHYRMCVDILRAEFDAAPEVSTTALFEQIRLNPGSI